MRETKKLDDACAAAKVWHEKVAEREEMLAEAQGEERQARVRYFSLKQDALFKIGITPYPPEHERRAGTEAWSCAVYRCEVAPRNTRTASTTCR